MKLFISWSGEFSKEIAEKLSVWIPSVLQSVEVFFSPNDIEKGENWDSRLTAELSESNYGIVCLTPQNVTAPWLHFEAGALSKSFESRVSALMIGVSPSDIKGPLSRFQNTKYDKKDFMHLIETINNCTEKVLNPNVLNYAFEGQWGRLEKDLDEIISRHSKGAGEVAPSKKAKDSNIEDAVEEILSLVRKMSVSLGRNAYTYVLPKRPSATLERSLRAAKAGDMGEVANEIYRILIETENVDKEIIGETVNMIKSMGIYVSTPNESNNNILSTGYISKGTVDTLSEKLNYKGLSFTITIG